MTDVINALNGQIEQMAGHIRGITAQLNAHKQVINTLLEDTFIVRTNLLLFQEANNVLMEEKKGNEALIKALNEKVIALTPTPENPTPVSE